MPKHFFHDGRRDGQSAPIHEIHNLCHGPESRGWLSGRERENPGAFYPKCASGKRRVSRELVRRVRMVSLLVGSSVKEASRMGMASMSFRVERLKRVRDSG